MEQAYDYMKCKACNRVLPGGTAKCVCEKALAVYGVPCNRDGVEQQRIPNAPPFIKTDEEKKTLEPEPPKIEKNGFQKWMDHLTSFWFYVLVVLCLVVWPLGEEIMNSAELEIYYACIAIPMTVITVLVGCVKFFKKK